MRTQWMLTIVLATAAAVSAAVREPVGAWTFDATDPNAAAVGQPLELTGSLQKVAGVTAGDGAILIGEGSYYTLRHGIAPNGSGTKVNEYTILIDFRYPASSLVDPPSGYNDLIQTDSTNASDSDITITSTGSVGIGALGYTGSAGFLTGPDTWYRLVMVVKNGVYHHLYFDGQLVMKGTQQGIDGRYSLEDVVLLFCAGNNQDKDDAPILVSTVAVWDAPLAPGEILALGTAGASVYNDNAGPEVDAGAAQDVELPESGGVTVALDGTVIDDGIYTVLWEKISGPNEIVFEDVTLEDATVTLETPGRYVLRLTADDGEFTASDTVTIAVHPANYGGLILQWNFEEAWNGRTLKDVSGNNLNGTLINGTGGLSSYTTGKQGQGLNLNNGQFYTNGDYAAVDLVMPDSGSIAMWYNPASLYNYHSVFDNSGDGDNWEMWIYGDSRARFRVEGDAYATANLNSLAPDNYCVGKWWHLVSTWQRTGNTVAVQLFVNGKLIESDPTGTWVDPGAQFFLSGGHANNHHGNGIYDNVRIYNRVLSTEEVLALVYTGNKPPLVTVGADQTLWLDEAGQVTVPLDGTVDDIDGSPIGKMELLWEKIQGPNEMVIANVKLEDTTVTISAPGSYVFRLTANDGQFSDDASLAVDVYPFGYTGLQVHLPLDGDPNTVVGATACRLVDGADGGHEYVPAMLGQGLRLWGSHDQTANDYVAVDYVYPDRGTVMLWFMPQDLYNYNSILDNSANPDDWEMWVYETGEFSARLQATNLRNNWMLRDTWYHIALVWKRSAVNPALVDEWLYINGELKGENPGGEWVDPGSQIFLGGGNPSQDDCNGVLDDFRIYDRPLPALEIKALASRSDFNGDLRVDLTDFGMLASDWLQTESPCVSAPRGDYNADCQIDNADLARFVQYWLALP